MRRRNSVTVVQYHFHSASNFEFACLCLAVSFESGCLRILENPASQGRTYTADHPCSSFSRNTVANQERHTSALATTYFWIENNNQLQRVEVVTRPNRVFIHCTRSLCSWLATVS